MHTTVVGLRFRLVAGGTSHDGVHAHRDRAAEEGGRGTVGGGQLGLLAGIEPVDAGLRRGGRMPVSGSRCWLVAPGGPLAMPRSLRRASASLAAIAVLVLPSRDWGAENPVPRWVAT